MLIPARAPGLFSLPCPLDTVRRSSTHACPWIILCPVFVIPVCYCPTLPVLTMSYNKALHMDPHVSRLVSPVTEYSANKGSSGFSNGYWPSMDMAGMLLTLEQGSRPLEDYIQEYLDLAHFSDLPDCVLIDFFCEGINQPLKSQLIREGPVHLSVSFWTMLCYVLALRLLWVSWRMNEISHPIV